MKVTVTECPPQSGDFLPGSQTGVRACIVVLGAKFLVDSCEAELEHWDSSIRNNDLTARRQRTNMKQA